MKILLTGGAGFVGSNIAKALLDRKDVELVRIVDNLSNGYYGNVEPLLSDPRIEFVHGDICDFDLCQAIMQDIDLVSHQAALGSVPRSIANPIATNASNINGTLNILTAAKDAGVSRVVFAASSSTYGDSEQLPKIENVIGKPLSPYAVTKYVMELYADVFSKLTDLILLACAILMSLVRIKIRKVPTLLLFLSLSNMRLQVLRQLSMVMAAIAEILPT